MYLAALKEFYDANMFKAYTGELSDADLEALDAVARELQQKGQKDERQ